jgi:hypothetical protein
MNTIRKTTVVRATAVLLLLIALVGLLGAQAAQTEAAPDVDVYKILPIGDSNTVGFSDKKITGALRPCIDNSYANYAGYRYWLHWHLQLDPDYIFPFVGTQEAGFCPSLYTTNDPTTGESKGPIWGEVTKDKVKFFGWSAQTTQSINTGSPNKGNEGRQDDWWLSDNWWTKVTTPTIGTDDKVIVLVHLGTNDLYWKLAQQTVKQLWDGLSKPALGGKPDGTKGILDKLDDAPVKEMTVILAKILPGEGINRDKDNNYVGELSSEKVEAFNLELEKWCLGKTDNAYQQSTDESQFVPCTNEELDPNTNDSTFAVYLVNMYNGFDLASDFQDDKIHLDEDGEAKMAQRWANAISILTGADVGSTEYPPVARDDYYHTSKDQPLNWPNVLANDVDVTGFPHIYYVRPDQAVQELRRFGSDWSSVRAGTDSAPTVRADSALGAYGRNFYYIGSDGHVQAMVYDEVQGIWVHTNLMAAVMQAGGAAPPDAAGGVLAVTHANGDARIYYFSGGHVHELAWVLGQWHHRDVTADAGGPAAAGESPLVAGNVINSAPVVYYVAADAHVHELRWYIDAWEHTDITADAGGLPVLLPGGLAATSVGGQANVFYQAQDQAGRHIRLLAQGAGGWSDADVSSPTSSLANVVDGAPLAATGRDVYYVGQDDHIHRQAWDDGQQTWVHTDLSDAAKVSFDLPEAAGPAIAVTMVQGAPHVYYLATAPNATNLRIQEIAWVDSSWQHADLGSVQGPLAVDSNRLTAITTGTDAPPLTAQFATGPAHGDLTLDSNGRFTYVPASGFEGTDSFTYKVVDSASEPGVSNLATVTIDVMPCERVAGNLIRNFCFTQNRWPWRFYTSARQGGFSTSSHNPYAGEQSAEITVGAPGKNVQFYQMNLHLEPRTTYELTFAAYASDGSDMQLFVHNHRRPYINYGLRAERIRLGTDWKVYRTEFTTPSRIETANARLRFWFAPFAQAGTVYHIDQVVLRKVLP